MIRNNPAHDTTNPAGSVRGSYKAPEDVQATLVAPSAEQRLQGLIKALLEYMPQIGEVQDENGDYVDACLRKIISENT